MCQNTKTSKGLTKILTLYPGCADEQTSPILKIHKIQHFATICEKPRIEISRFYEQNHFITNAYD